MVADSDVTVPSGFMTPTRSHAASGNTMAKIMTGLAVAAEGASDASGSLRVVAKRRDGCRRRHFKLTVTARHFKLTVTA